MVGHEYLVRIFEWIIKWFGLAGAPITSLFLIFLVIFFLYPEKFEKVVTLLHRFLAFISEKHEKMYIAKHIENTIECKRKEIEDIMPYKIIDYVISEDILEKDPIALKFFKEMIGDDIKGHEKTIEQLKSIHAQGLLTRVLLQEYGSLAKFSPMEPNNNIHNETELTSKARKTVELLIEPIISAMVYNELVHVTFRAYARRKYGITSYHGFKRFFIEKGDRGIWGPLKDIHELLEELDVKILRITSR